ncbi:prolipoprotein diacylglyceryl transferase [Thiolapillus brandeum]|uniref:Phosphatidylglycerol--prolipoprotein diacylglyceryl transferase n=1 Tax=Thiolapillus brandeum TaxID=1076588 RepID=A0A7U6GG48_9GAMM|nr:prolipoprotein diacylglyceryl transferase [Thiolapillus brandeum]BAO42989.1 phosphatidylglycerol:prolipoprotein diacylglycerol transferase [Thiolapillus brandeum]
MIYPNIDPVALSLGPLKVHWYGLMYLIGMLGGWALARWRVARSKTGWTAQEVDDLLFYCAIGVVLGGRLGYILFYGFGEWLADPMRIFRVWEGGMSFHGGFLGVLAAMWLYQRKYHKSFFELTDFIAPYITIGLFTGRLGNFINGELWGKPTDLPWAMRLRCEEFVSLCRDKLGLPPGTEWTPPLHPNQLYEALGEGVLLFILLWWFSSRPRPRMAVSALFLIGYGFFRFLIEFVRMPDVQLGYLAGGWLTMGQVLSFPMIIVGVFLMILAYGRSPA